VLPQLRKIEELYPDDVAVIGVHSGKYIAERETARILEASLRYELTHPIVNDRQFRIWRSYAVRAWPTLVVIDRNGYAVGAHAGEFTSQMIAPLLTTLVAMSAGDTGHGIVHFPADSPQIPPGFLRYPGKVAVSGARIGISDTGNHRVLLGILETERRMRVDSVVTAWEPGTGGAFRSPQGLAFDNDTLYVTDSTNHTVTATDVATGNTTVVAGTGAQMRTRADREAGALSSPWDVVAAGRRLYVAMAGVHQIWSIDLDTHAIRVHCGAGGEDLADGPQLSALLAQPMGITSDGARLYFADSESSAIRWSDFSDSGNVGTIIGTGLFDFGDVDGAGDKVRMQHQQGVALHPTGEIMVADSYNNAIKLVNPETREARTWLRGFHEPGGIAAAEGVAYVADTNAHRIMVADYARGDLSELEIIS
jgi:DNA-binding beta-propeller fold protein YncE